MKTKNPICRSLISTLLCMGLLSPATYGQNFVVGPTTGVAGVDEVHNLGTSMAEFIKPYEGGYDGEVKIDDKFNPLADVKPLTGGPWNREYNGVPAGGGDPIAEDKYLAQSLELTSFLWGIAEVGEKLCKPVGEKHPPSLVSWWKVIKNYIAAEKIRDNLMKQRIEIMNGKMEELTGNTAENAALQLKAINYQIELLNISIDSLSGSTLFSMDSKAGESRATARIPWREALLVQAAKSAKENTKENEKIVKVYKQCTEGVNESIAIAQKACERTKDVEECTEGENSGVGAQVCTTKKVPDPVPGSCAMASSYLPILQRGPLTDLATLYLTVPIPSKQINERGVRVGQYIDKAVSMYPKSDDKNFDWTSPLKPCQEKQLLTTFKDGGMICPSNVDDKAWDKAKVAGIGESNDPIMQVGRYALGVHLNEVEYEFARRAYEDFKAKGMDDFQAEAALNDLVVGSERGKAYLTGGTYDKIGDAAFHDKLAGEYKLEVKPCTAEKCSTFSGTKSPEPDYKLPPASAVSDSAKTFLATMGIYEPSLEATTKKFQENWNFTDMYLGQPIDREPYFKYVDNLISKVVEADKVKVSIMLQKRERLLKLYADTKALFEGKKQEKPTPGTKPTNNPSNGPVLANALGAGSSAVSSGEGVYSAVGASGSAANGNGSGRVNYNSATADGTAGANSYAAAGNSVSDTGAGANAASMNSSSGLSRSANGANRSVTGRNYALSSSAANSIAEIKKDAGKNSIAQYDQMRRFAKNAAVDEKKLATTLESKLGGAFDKNFVKKNSSGLASAMNGVYDPAGLAAAASSMKSASYTPSSDSSGSAGSAFNRSGSYSSGGSYGGGSAGSYGSRSPSSTNSAPEKNEGFFAGVIPPKENTRPVPKPDLFKKISNRYNSSRNKLGLENVDQ